MLDRVDPGDEGDLRERLDISSEKKLGGNVKSVAEEQIADIKHLSMTSMYIHLLSLPFQRPTIRNRPKQRLHMALKAMQITHTVPRKLRPDQLSTSMPLGAICREDAVTQEVLPLIMEPLSLAKVTELSSEKCLDVLGVGSEDDAHVEQPGFGGP